MVKSIGTLSTKCSCPPINTIMHGDVREVLTRFPDNYFDLMVTSPPYFNLRNYTYKPEEVGREKTADQFITTLLDIFEIGRKKLKRTGSLWVNIADKYDHGPTMVPERFAWMMARVRGWHLVNDVIWYKIGAMAESTNRRFSQKYEHFYWFAKDRDNYYFNVDASKIPAKPATIARFDYKFNEGKSQAISRMRSMIGDMHKKADEYLKRGVNAGDLWPMPTNKRRVEHAAPYPVELVVRPIMACCPPDGIVFDPFMGSGTTAIAALTMGEGRKFNGSELNEKSIEEAMQEIEPLLAQPTLF